MEKTFFLLLVLIVSNVFAQNKLKGLVLDYDTKKPIEYVDIYNKLDFTSTNSEGRFLFTSTNDSIKIGLIGYEPIFTTFKTLKNDTILLKSKFEKLDEVIISNENPILKVYNSVSNNYPSEPFTEAFFLRCYIKKNGVLLKIQDLNGYVSRKTLFGTPKKTMPKNNYKVHISNVRKAGIQEEDVYFKMYDLEKIFNEVAGAGLNIKEYNFKESVSKDTEFAKYSFYPKSGSTSINYGYYLVNNSNNAFTEFYLKQADTTGSYTENRGIKYRTTYFEKLMLLKENVSWNKYFIDKAKINAQTEVIDKNGLKTIYNITYSFIVLNQNNSQIIKNESINKDIFKIKKSFNSKFWREQKYLLLTNEMTNFINTLQGKTNEFKIITNIKE